MSNRIAIAHSDRIDGPLLRAIGSLAVGSAELRRVREDAEGLPADPNIDGWRQFADHLLESVDAVIEGATHGQHAANTIIVIREGASVPVGLDYLVKLSTKVERHARVALALGVESAENGDLSLAV